MASLELNFLDASRIRAFRLTEGGALAVEIAGDRCVCPAVLKRAFPLSRSEEYVSLQDASGKEVGILRTLEGLDASSRDLIMDALERRYFTPKITRLVNLSQEGGLWTFEVETTRGNCTFFVRNWRDSSSEISPGRFIIQSVDGQRFEIPNLDALDTRSQTLIEQMF